MPRAERSIYIARARERESRATATVDFGVAFRVYERKTTRLADGSIEDDAVPGRLLPHRLGGTYDPVLRQYIGPAKRYHEFTCLPVFEQVLDATERRVILVGAQGSGKSENVVLAAVEGLARYPARPGGIVSPVLGKQSIAWDKLIEVLRSADFIKPNGIRNASKGRPAEIHCINDAVAQFVSAKRQSKSSVSPIGGFGWFWGGEEEQQAFDDRSELEVTMRGRVNADKYKVTSSATNDAIYTFQNRLRRYRKSGDAKVIECSGYDNVFVPVAWWDQLKGSMSTEDFQRFVMCAEVAESGRVFHGYSAKHSHKEIPAAPQIGSLDITPKITMEKYQKPYEFVVGVDFGSLESAAVVLKAYQGAGRDEREWYALHEIVVADKTTDFFAQQILKFFNNDPSRFVCIADPHEYKEVDRSDYTLFRKAGINVVRAAGSTIHQKHRISVVNTLLDAADGRRRLFLAEHRHGQRPYKLERLGKGLAELMKDALGNTIRPKADRHHIGTDMTHVPDALSFGVFPFERHRWAGNPTPELKPRRQFGT